MASGVFDSILLQHVWGTEELRGVFNDDNRVQKWFDYEAALAVSQAELGIIPAAAATEIAAKHIKDCGSLLNVGLLRSQTVRVHMTDFVGSQSGIAQCGLHRVDECRASSGDSRGTQHARRTGAE